MQLKINQFEYPSLIAAWEGINEFIANNEPKVRESGGDSYGTEYVMYDTFIHILKPYIPDDFNFGRILGYRYKKWSKLINNYIDFNYLDLVKAEVNSREGKKSSHYTYTYHFDNSHGSGKDCLISLTFSRRKKQENPFVIYNTRASEVTSRMIFDFLLIQRMIEYVYGKGKTVEVVCNIPYMFLNVERYLIYMAHKGKKKSLYNLRDGVEPNMWQKRIQERYEFFATKDIESIRYKVHKRVALQVQKDKDGNPLAKAPDLYAKDLTLPYRPKKKDKDIDKLNQTM